MFGSFCGVTLLSMSPAHMSLSADSAFTNAWIPRFQRSSKPQTAACSSTTVRHDTCIRTKTVAQTFRDTEQSTKHASDREKCAVCTLSFVRCGFRTVAYGSPLLFSVFRVSDAEVNRTNSVPPSFRLQDYHGAWAP